MSAVGTVAELLEVGPAARRLCAPEVTPTLTLVRPSGAEDQTEQRSGCAVTGRRHRR